MIGPNLLNLFAKELFLLYIQKGWFVSWQIFHRRPHRHKIFSIFVRLLYDRFGNWQSLQWRNIVIFAWRFDSFLCESILLIFVRNYHSLWWFTATLLFLTFGSLLAYRIVSKRKSIARWIRRSFNMKTYLFHCIFAITCGILCQKTRCCFTEIFIFFFVEWRYLIVLHGLMLYLKICNKQNLFYLDFTYHPPS